MKRDEAIRRLEKLGFKTDDEGVICYKRFNAYRSAPPYWRIKEGSFIRERVNRNRNEDCGEGINVGTLRWINDNTCWGSNVFYCASAPITHRWKCRIRYEDCRRVVIPVASGGKIRCGRLELLYKVDRLGRRLPAPAPQRTGKPKGSKQ
jgi:predicted RNA binding protein YcfA (HicA-like mRNA interferase family)